MKNIRMKIIFGWNPLWITVENNKVTRKLKADKVRILVSLINILIRLK